MRCPPVCRIRATLKDGREEERDAPYHDKDAQGERKNLECTTHKDPPIEEKDAKLHRTQGQYHSKVESIQ